MKRKIAIVERLPGHTEDMGGFASLALELGYETHLFFEPSDAFQMVDYFRTRLPIGDENIHEWSSITNPDADYDIIVLNTSFVWLDYGPWLQQWDARQRLIVVHHHPEDTELNPYGTAVYLTPARGEERWVFPLYGRPAGPDGSALPGAAPAPEHATGLPALVCLGTFEGKDVAGARAYMQAGGKVAHYDRHRCTYFSTDGGLYTHHRGLDGIQFVQSLGCQPRPMFLWLPIVSPSDYMVCRFTAALIIGVEMNCIMVVPERLRKLYGFPPDAVISYDASVTEPLCLEQLRAPSENQQERQRRLAQWAVERWQKNLGVFQALIDG